jgi:hypothetical protein
VIHAVALEITLAVARAQGHVFQAALRLRRTDHCPAATVAQHEVDQMRVLARAVGVMAGRAGCLYRCEMSVVGKGPGLVAREEAAIVALVAQVMVLR